MVACRMEDGGREEKGRSVVLSPRRVDLSSVRGSGWWSKTGAKLWWMFIFVEASKSVLGKSPMSITT